MEDDVPKINDVVNDCSNDEQIDRNEEMDLNYSDNIKLEAEIKNKGKKKKFTIMGLSIWRILAYFIIYSFVGYVIETFYGIMTKGTWESRQSFLYGPFCAIYGLGASIMLIFLHKYSKRYTTLIFGGFIIGSITEYMVSWIGELILGVKWWDYSNIPLNINGRICVYFSLFWGFLALYLVASFNPRIDRFIYWVKGKISLKALKTLTFSVIVLLFIDCVVSSVALSFFLIRMIAQNDLNVDNKEIVMQKYDEIYGNEKLADFIYKFWGDRKMIRTFPNIKVEDADGNIIYMDSLLKDVQPYYLKVHEPKNIELKFKELRGRGLNLLNWTILQTVI